MPRKNGEKSLDHQGNAPAHRSLDSMDTAHDSGFELADHSPYSPDLTIICSADSFLTNSQMSVYLEKNDAVTNKKS